MSKIIVFNSLTLDGVMQAPARPDEDVRGDFPYGGWATPYSDPEMGRAAAESGATAGGLLLGRQTYEDFYQIWPNRTDNPYTEVLNNSQKYVASRTLKEPLPWMNSTLLKGNVQEAVAALKAQQDKDLVILGSGELIQTLMQHQLIDQYVLLIHPLILGTGRRLFRDGSAYSTLQLADSKTTPNGVVIATYQPAK
jgi:dihydrofolate reductase